MPKVLIVEDDLALVATIIDVLAPENLIVEHAANGQDALQLLTQFHYDLVLLDWHLPGMSGVEICQRYRAHGGEANIIMMTARHSIEDKEEGFAAGVEDYLPKPFNARELVLRVRAHLKRSQKQDTFSYGGIQVNVRTCEVLIAGLPLELRPKEFALLEFFVRNPERFFKSSELLERLSGSDASTSLDAVRVWVYRLRGKLPDIKDGAALMHKPGAGYSLRLHSD